jgi:ABC-type lipoprotein export system ATPase subunit
MVIIYRLFDTYDFPTQELTAPGNVRGILPLSVLPARLAMMRNKLAIVPRTAAERPLVDAFIQDMSALHPALNGSTIGGAGFSSKPLRDLYVPGFGDVVRVFDSPADLEAFVSDPEYDRRWEAGTGEKVWGAIVFNSGPPAWDYAIRMNESQVVTTGADPVDVLRRGHQFTEVDKYSEARLLTTGPPFLQEKGTEVSRQPYPGFLTLQAAVDKWILNETVAADALDETRHFARFADAIRRLLPPLLGAEVQTDLRRINNTDPARAAAIVADARAWLREDTYAPQQVDFIPFPFRGYTSNGFYGLVLGILSFFFVIGFVFPVSRLIRGLVLEKEMKLREGMRMMGLSDAALFGSWLATYAIFWAILAIIITGVASRSMFKASSGGAIWALFFLFGLSATTFSYLISVFFSRAKTASSLGVVIFIAAYFPTFSVSGTDVSRGTKTAASLLCPTAFGLAINLVGALEDNGAGATPATMDSFINNYSVNAAYGMLVLDTFLYGFLAWYIDNVLPASIREFGVPRPWLFPFMASYWREVFNLPAPAGAVPPAAAVRSSPSPSGGAGILARVFGSRSPAAASGGAAAAGGHGSPLERVARVDASYLEEPDANLRAKEREGRCVAVRGLRKEFDTPDGVKVAVDNIDLTMYEGQIFVLLGHNGAGKTTTISMLTGLTPATSGNAVVFGRDVSTQLTDVRRDLGVCPQHDVLWPELTVREHLQVFAAIKGVPRANVNTEISKAIADVGLTEKINIRSSQLSGGQKRKLSVCIALAGGSRVIFL